MELDMELDIVPSLFSHLLLLFYPSVFFLEIELSVELVRTLHTALHHFNPTLR